MYHILIYYFLFLGPYLASLNLDRHLLECEKGDKSDEKVPSKFGMDSERPGMDSGNKTNRYWFTSKLTFCPHIAKMIILLT